MKTLDVLAFVDDLMKTHCRQKLTAAERLVLAAAWQGKTYDEIAQGSTYKANTLHRTVATSLWKKLTFIFNEPVTKRNLRAVVSQRLPALEQTDHHTHFNQDRSSVVRSNLTVVGAQIPDVSRFYGRDRELSQLQTLVDTHRCVMLVGVEGIGKRSLVARLIQTRPLPFDIACWKPVHYKPKVQQFVVDILRVLTGESWQDQDFDCQLSGLINVLQARRCLLVLDSADALLEGEPSDRCLSSGYLSVFRRIVEETKSCLLLTCQEVISEIEEGFSLRGYLSTSLPVGGLTIEDSKQFFIEAALLNQDQWEDAIISLGRHPLLLRQVASWVKNRMGGSFENLGAKTIQLGIVQAWFDELFRDAVYLSPLDRQVLLDLAHFQSLHPAQVGITISELIERNRVSVASIDRLLRSALIEVSLQPHRREQVLTLSPLLQKYLLTDPRGLVHRPLSKLA
ncbi:hypothetical protein ACQ4M3_29105 [Leptolyngbya sp. AN03gr2]|uniref:nSTAND1 domain-containing NTPase n=1 Tax=unclassified Leptolyngbya TaxID=2650499 RepID=UPI003D3122CA